VYAHEIATIGHSIMEAILQKWLTYTKSENLTHF
jgi:hypothetical protein